MEQERKSNGARTLVIIFVVGLVLGVVAGLFAPNVLGDRLPGAVRRSEALVTGIVLARQREPDRLLLTVETSEGALLATIREKIEEIGLLVDIGDTLTFELRRYSPFIDDPTIAGVRKAGAPAMRADEPVPETEAASDTLDFPAQRDSLDIPEPEPALEEDSVTLGA